MPKGAKGCQRVPKGAKGFLGCLSRLPYPVRYGGVGIAGPSLGSVHVANSGHCGARKKRDRLISSCGKWPAIFIILGWTTMTGVGIALNRLAQHYGWPAISVTMSSAMRNQGYKEDFEQIEECHKAFNAVMMPLLVEEVRGKEKLFFWGEWHK